MPWASQRGMNPNSVLSSTQTAANAGLTGEQIVAMLSSNGATKSLMQVRVYVVGCTFLLCASHVSFCVQISQEPKPVAPTVVVTELQPAGSKGVNSGPGLDATQPAGSKGAKGVNPDLDESQVSSLRLALHLTSEASNAMPTFVPPNPSADAQLARQQAHTRC